MGIYSQIGPIGSGSGNTSIIQTQIASGSTNNITFTTGITGFDVYRLNFYGVTLSVNNALLLMQFSTDGGVSYSSTGYSTNGYLAFDGFLVNRQESEAGCVVLDTASNAGSQPAAGSCDIYYLSNTAFNKHVFTTAMGQINDAVIGCMQLSNQWTTNTAVNAIQLITSSGNISTGTFKLYGVAN